ncbi:hypothetical protein PV332_10485 [Streptomyces scabiei]|uniref:hypothetical protein n=1 Tax=Streptomyces scabiei TaxID=1930 RepID=UPI0029ACC76E|nr:hypothetical protein [Streptomyces scabiei]MDX2575907.1 hypothetical protein [Streptomyces scabiei]MDX2885620.1 hypothetical protein [Streptomyces scabiei]MDX2993427.1 hypothetical protein [Streptomyces scabiei]MDX3028459.1 hypothetical protein [Streptomyces scabiei]MDX3047207.1 hypothetical protein [Streptomyces scabiei]
MNSFLDYLSTLALCAFVKLQIFAAQEPVRLRAALTSAVIAAALFVPALSAPGLAEKIGAVGVVALPILVGESTRSRVTPA